LDVAGCLKRCSGCWRLRGENRSDIRGGYLNINRGRIFLVDEANRRICLPQRREPVETNLPKRVGSKNGLAVSSRRMQ
tara:strand:+ start:385 stop:618 length:234 start_codon:yes stop_codon:yes gene_type:complete